MRLIAIDNHSGFIWFDTLDQIIGDDMTPAMACRHYDDMLANREGPLDYEEHGIGYRPASNEAAYFVYEATDDFPPVEDGQDQRMIDAVERDCKLIAIVTVCETDDGRTH